MAKMMYVLVMVFLAITVVPWTFAQLPTGTILGVVKDSSGAVIPGATVTVRNDETAITRTVATGDDGAYRVPDLPVGRYTLKFVKDGFQTETQTGLTLEVGQELTINSALRVGSSTQEVTVTGEVPIVDTSSSTLGGTVNQANVEDLPLNGRNWVDLALLQPGITQHNNHQLGGSETSIVGIWFVSNGATTRSNNYMLDGALMSNVFNTSQASVASLTLGVDGIREYKVETSNFGAEYGLFMGSQTTIVTKSGSNSFHGDAFEYLRNSSLDAANFFDNPITSSGKRLPPFKRNQFGGAVGGPIRKDKTFFFVVFEDVIQNKGLTLIGVGIPASCRVPTSNPCATASSGVVNPVVLPFLGDSPSTGTPDPSNGQLYFPLPNGGLPSNEYSYPFVQPVREWQGQIRLDETFSQKDTAFVRYTYDTGTILIPPGTDTIPNPNSYDHLKSSQAPITVSETHVFSPTLINTARFSISRNVLQSFNWMPDYPCASGPCAFAPELPPAAGIGTVTPGSGYTALSRGNQVDHEQKIYVYSDDVFYTRGKHALKFGYLGTHWIQDYNQYNGPYGTISFSSLANMLAGNYISTSAANPGANPKRDLSWGTLGTYAQDDIRLTPRLTVNAGLRYEILAPNFYVTNGTGNALVNIATDAATTPEATPFNNPSLHDFAPRTGFAWDVFGNGKTALKGGAGIYYDIGGYGTMISQEANGDPAGPVVAGITNPGSPTTTITPSLATASCTAPPLTIPFVFPSCWLAKTLTIASTNVKQVTLFSYNLTLEQQLPGGVGLSIGYAGSHAWHVLDRQESNPCTPTAIIDGAPDWANATNTSCPLGRLNPNWLSITMPQSNSEQWYDALLVTATKRLNKGLQFQATYDWSHIDTEGYAQQSTDSSFFLADSGYMKLSKSRAIYDVRQNLRINVTYNFPKTSAAGFKGGLMNGWWVSSIISAQTGYPFYATETDNRSLSAMGGSNGDNLNIAPGRTPYNITHGVSTANGIDPCPTAGQPLGTPNLFYDPCAFTLQPTGYLGNEPFNILTGPGLSEVDFSLVKDTPVKYLGEAGKMEFRVETFNILNHPSFVIQNEVAYTGAPADVIETPLATAGEITNTVNNSRQIQFAVRFEF